MNFLVSLQGHIDQDELDLAAKPALLQGYGLLLRVVPGTTDTRTRTARTG